MKKALSLILCLIMVAAMAVSTISAEETKLIDARELQAYGQYHFYLGEPATGTAIPDVTDAKISENEYKASFEAKVDSTGADFLTYWADHDEGAGAYWDTEWSKFYINYDAETIYFGYEAKDTNFVVGKERVCHMLSMWDVGTQAGAVGRMNFLCKTRDTGLLEVEMQNFRKAPDGGWDWDEKLDLATFYNEGAFSYDEETQIVTIEISVKLDAIKEWWGNELDLEETRMYYAPYARYYGESVEGAGDVVCQGILWCYLRGDVSTDLKMNFVLDYPDISYWGSPMMFPHIVHFCEEPEPTTPAPTEATTDAIVGETTTETTTKATTTAKATTAAATDAPAATTAAPATTEAEKGCGGTIALSALALVPMLGAAVVFGKKKED
jgi:hypothetical protein